MRKTPVAMAIGLALSTQVQAAEPEQLPAIQVDAAPLAEPVSSDTPDAISAAPSADGGDLLRNISGVSGSRMGGQAVDPIIRGQSATQVNILLDGAYVHGACPNRMDPPTAYSATESFDSVTVIKGSQTVVHGGGGSGGTVLFERRTPRFSDDGGLRGEVSGGYRNNADTRELAADVATGNANGFLRAIVDWKDADNYEDGDGNEVHSAYQKHGGTVILGYTPDAATRLELSADIARERDSLYAGAGMDSPYSDANTYRLRLDRGHAAGPFDAVKAELYVSDVEHLMDNYSLRPNMMPMWKKAPSTSDTVGGRVSTELSSGDALWTIGADLQRNARDAERLRGMAGMDPSMVEAILWPDADLDQTGVFAELELPAGRDGTLTGGLRYDYVDAGISRGDEAYDVTQSFMGETPTTTNELYALYYADVQSSSTEHNLGGFLRYEQPVLGGKARASIGISRSVRTADATERYLGSRMIMMPGGMPMDMSWVGNPALAPEKHHQLEAGLSWGGKGWQSRLNVFYNKVDDFILRDRARAQAGILVNRPSVTIYRNVDATLTGFEWEGERRWSRTLSSRASIAYVNAQNDSDDRSISQTPPLEASISLDYRAGAWELGSQVRANATQNEIDPLSGLDVGQTSGWAVLDLHGRYRPNKTLTLSAGVDNLFDSTYAYHVNRAARDPFDPSATQVNEPGRSLWLKAAARF